MTKLLSPEHHFWAEYTRQYIRGTRKGCRNYDWELTLEQVKELGARSCHYCGIAPRKNENAKKEYLRKRPGRTQQKCPVVAESRVGYSNGLDREDNSKGYTICNVVPCCSQCNHSKKDYSVTEFEDWALRLAEHILLRKEAELQEELRKKNPASPLLAGVNNVQESIRLPDSAKEGGNSREEVHGDIPQALAEIC